ncbi:hypothetical protein ACFU99_44270 [Streptomyces sp. NPDC057654]
MTGAGHGLDWPEERRSLLRTLRAHPSPDVRRRAARVRAYRRYAPPVVL